MCEEIGPGLAWATREIGRGAVLEETHVELESQEAVKTQVRGSENRTHQETMFS